MMRTVTDVARADRDDGRSVGRPAVNSSALFRRRLYVRSIEKSFRSIDVIFRSAAVVVVLACVRLSLRRTSSALNARPDTRRRRRIDKTTSYPTAPNPHRISFRTRARVYTVVHERVRNHVVVCVFDDDDDV